MPNKKKILIVDDDASMLDLLKTVLSSERLTSEEYEIITFFGSADEIREKLCQDWDCIIMDNVLAEVGLGINFLGWMRKEGIYTQVIMISGAPMDEQRVANPGAYFTYKPTYDLEIFVRWVEGVISPDKTVSAE